jgi:hypothetical protein
VDGSIYYRKGRKVRAAAFGQLKTFGCCLFNCGIYQSRNDDGADRDLSNSISGNFRLIQGSRFS